MKRTKPDLGHLTHPRKNFCGAGSGEGIIVGKRGIEVMVMQFNGEMIWVMRDQIGVTCESR